MEWAPSLWKYIHKIALKNNNPSDEIITLFELLGDVIPCEVCKLHYKTYLSENKIESDLFLWTIQLHNSVNEKLGKYSNYDLRDGMIAHDHDCTHDFIQILIPYLKQNDQLFDLFLKTYPCSDCSLVEPETPPPTVKLCLDCDITKA
jgi:hypothetical protein